MTDNSRKVGNGFNVGAFFAQRGKDALQKFQQAKQELDVLHEQERQAQIARNNEILEPVHNLSVILDAGHTTPDETKERRLSKQERDTKADRIGGQYRKSLIEMVRAQSDGLEDVKEMLAQNWKTLRGGRYVA